VFPIKFPESVPAFPATAQTDLLAQDATLLAVLGQQSIRSAVRMERGLLIQLALET